MLTVAQLHRSRQWVILGLPTGCRHRWCGPYRTKAEAEDDRRGLERWLRANWRGWEADTVSS